MLYIEKHIFKEFTVQRRNHNGNYKTFRTVLNSENTNNLLH